MWIFHNRLPRCAGEARVKVSDISTKMTRLRNATRTIPLRKNPRYRAREIMITIKIEKTVGERRVRTKIIENMSAGKKIKIGERKTDRTIDTRMNEEIEEGKRNGGIGTRRIGKKVTAKTGQKEEIRETRATIGEETIAKRDRKEGVKETSIAIGNVDIVIARERGPRKKRTILGTDRTSIKENGEERMMLKKF